MPNMDLRYSHKAELLHSLLVAMVTVFHSNKGYLYFHDVELLHRSFVAMVTVELEILPCG